MANGKTGLAEQMERRPEAPERLPKMFESVESRNGRSDEGLDRGWPRSATPSSSAGRSLRWCTPTAGPIRAKKFVRVLRTNGSSDRWARTGTCADNAAMESFFALLQKNVLDRQHWQTREELRLAIVYWIERTYHRWRRQRALGKLTPIEFAAVHEVAHAA